MNLTNSAPTMAPTATPTTTVDRSSSFAHRQVLPAAAMAVAVGAAVLSMIAITADNVRPVSPPPAAVVQLPVQQPETPQPAVPRPAAQQPTGQRQAAAESLQAGRAANLDACGRPVVAWRAGCR